MARTLTLVAIVAGIAVAGTAWAADAAQANPETVAKLAVAGPPAVDGAWIHAGRTSAVVYWRLNDISKEAKGYVEWGETDKYGHKTQPAAETRWAQFHRLSGLAPGKTYHYRMVIVDGAKETPSPDRTFTTDKLEQAVEIKVADGKPSAEGASVKNGVLLLNKSDTTYILTGDLQADGTAIQIAAPGITLELDGHTVSFSNNADKQVFGIHVNAANAKVFNGRVVQGDKGTNYCAAITARGGHNGVEVAGVSTDVRLKDAYPMNVFGKAPGTTRIHHNEFYSSVTKITSRHYPGNDLLRVDADATSDIEINDNLFIKGCHRVITFMGATAKKAEIHHNDIRHTMLFINGYGFQGDLGGAKIYRNRITSNGRTVHLSAPNVEYYENWASTVGQMARGDMPKNTNPKADDSNWQKTLVELHGIKFEGDSATGCKVHDNFMKIVQPQPDALGEFVPATPLNVGATNPSAMNEVYDNTIVALTTYKKTRHGPYAASGQWAAAIYFVTNVDNTEAGKYFIYIHDNQFVSNDLFVAGIGYEKTGDKAVIRIEKNTFTLADNPTEKPAVFYKVPDFLMEAVKKGDNTFVGLQP